MKENGHGKAGNGGDRDTHPIPISIVKSAGDAVGPAGAARSIYPSTALRPKKLPWRSDEHDLIVGSSPEIAKVRDLIALYGPEPEPVLICGETGTGKEAVAHQLHRQGSRKAFDFVVRNVGRVDRDLVGSDFFGHERGAFSGASERREGLFEKAHRGSLHLDEIGELPLELQANLLRVIEDGVVTPLGASTPFVVDVRIIAATNVDLAAAAADGAFRKDLYYRLAVLTIDLPPLRRRGDDSVEIADHLVRRFSENRNRSCSLSNGAKDAIRRCDWPGNVRELKNVLLRAVIHRGEGAIEEEHLAMSDLNARSQTPGVRPATDLLTRYLTALALEQENGVTLAASRRLGMNREKCAEIGKRLQAEGDDARRLRAELKRLLGF